MVGEVINRVMYFTSYVLVYYYNTVLTESKLKPWKGQISSYYVVSEHIIYRFVRKIGKDHGHMLIKSARHSLYSNHLVVCRGLLLGHAC